MEYFKRFIWSDFIEQVKRLDDQMEEAFTNHPDNPREGFMAAISTQSLTQIAKTFAVLSSKDNYAITEETYFAIQQLFLQKLKEKTAEEQHKALDALMMVLTIAEHQKKSSSGLVYALHMPPFSQHVLEHCSATELERGLPVLLERIIKPACLVVPPVNSGLSSYLPQALKDMEQCCTALNVRFGALLRGYMKNSNFLQGKHMLEIWDHTHWSEQMVTPQLLHASLPKWDYEQSQYALRKLGVERFTKNNAQEFYKILKNEKPSAIISLISNHVNSLEAIVPRLKNLPFEDALRVSIHLHPHVERATQYALFEYLDKASESCTHATKAKQDARQNMSHAEFFKEWDNHTLHGKIMGEIATTANTTKRKL